MLAFLLIDALQANTNIRIKATWYFKYNYTKQVRFTGR
jgi:hypothetical protein